MDMQKIGNFLKALRKEKGLTQEQLAEILGVAGRTVSRWETASNMPDLSILIQLAEYYDVDVKEILDGERRNDTMDKDLRETLEKVADYNEIERQKAASIGNSAFGITFIACAIAIAMQLVIFANIRLVAGETIALVIGGVVYIVLMANSGVWDSGFMKKRSPLSDGVLSIIIGAVFSVLYALTISRMSDDLSKVAVFVAGFFVAISIICFAVLRIVSLWSNRKKGDR